jgi:class III poly(R)-hydroxyalkanoic acid synthase PhaE subunit
VNDPQFDPWSSASFLKAWEGYLVASQGIWERLKDSNANARGSIPLPIFGAWQELAKSFGMQSGIDHDENFKPEDLVANLAPALGWSRDYQRIAQRMLQIGNRFQHSYAEFLQQSADICERALQATRRRAADDARLANSPVAAYEAWIDSAEEAYSQAAHGEAFSRTLGELCNLLSAFKVERGKLLEMLARHLDLPSRTEVDSLHRQVRELNAAMRAAASQPKLRKPGGT